MGLDMYLTGRRSYFGSHQPKDEEGHLVGEVRVDLGYWRKHANLHGYIVATFGPKEDNGEVIDDCREIELTMENLVHLLEVVKDPTNMPKTEGFFFGRSDNDQQQIDDDVAIFTRAIGFLTAPKIMGTPKRDEGYGSSYRAVVYRASW